MKELQNKLLGALVGLARASESKEIFESTGAAFVDGLKLAYSDKAELLPQAEAMIDRLHQEKNLMAPDCAACQYPCGRTFDYDMEEVYGASEALRTAKLELLAALAKVAALDHGSDAKPIRQFLSDALFQISCTYEAGQLSGPMEQAAAILGSRESVK